MNRLITSLLSVCLLISTRGPAVADDSTPLWNLARANVSAHQFSTLFTAHDVKNYLSTSNGVRNAVNWCKATGVTKVYIESFRDGYTADRATLQQARDEFRREHFAVAGCITTTKPGKASTRWNIIGCYTDRATQDRIAEIFSAAASLFDEIMIDDFWFTDCSCADCDRARAARQVTIGDSVTPVAGDTWEDYRRELMLRMSRERVLAPARRANKGARLIIKYPQWYDAFHERGYDVDLETTAFDRIWVGTETRDYADARWGGTVQYEAYFIMRWLGGIGGEKCGGGWYDWLGTTEATYVEQARQTVLGGARESLLFCYGGLQGTTGPKNIEALRAHVPELLDVAKQVATRALTGVAAYKPVNSHAGPEKRVFDFIGMLGIPLVPCHEFPVNAPAAFFSIHALKDPDFAHRFGEFVRAGKPVLITDGLATALHGAAALDAPNVRVLSVKDDPKSLLQMDEAKLGAIREPLLRPLKITFSAPSRIALYTFADGSWVVENFNDQPVTIELNGKRAEVPKRGWAYEWRERSNR